MFGMRRDLRARLGERVRLLRQARGWTQEDLGERAALSYKFVGQIERGRGNPSIETLQRLSGALGVDVTELFGSPGFVAREEGYSLTPEELSRVREALDSAGGVLKRLASSRRKAKRKRS
jgi:transcriptional regulator with XRE-family HTH domain